MSDAAVPIAFIASFVVSFLAILIKSDLVFVVLPIFGFGWLFVFIYWGLLR